MKARLGGDLCLEFARGGESGELCRHVWDATEPRRMRQFLWDVAEPGKREALRRSVREAELVCIARDGGRIAACALFSPTSPGSHTAAAHFLFCRAHAAATHIARRAVELAPYACVLGVVPAPWRGTRALLRRIGFAGLAMLPGSAFIASHNRLVDAELMIWRRAFVGNPPQKTLV